nr:3-oxoacyl-[acyl-carrier-protein] synthase I, chloroplastic-like [Ipomoea trifida]
MLVSNFFDFDQICTDFGRICCAPAMSHFPYGVAVMPLPRRLDFVSASAAPKRVVIWFWLLRMGMWTMIGRAAATTGIKDGEERPE